MKRGRPLGCLSGTALVAALLAVAGVAAAAAASGNGIFSPGPLNAEAGPSPHGDIRRHADLARQCDRCHPSLLSGERMGDRCLDCHVEVSEEIASERGLHRGFATPANCRACHTEHKGSTASLTRANISGFPHERSGFFLWTHPMYLDGGGFTCADCHPRSLREFQSDTCYACHFQLDPSYTVQHRATFGLECLECHDGIDTFGDTFHHDVGPFHLEGRHAEIECVFCHQGGKTLEDLRRTPTACLGCHLARDIHEGRLGSDCGECHSADGWGSARLDHGRTRFALTGLHLSVPCEACHVGRQWVGVGLTCAACHSGEDRHGGQFLQDCDACHATSGWGDLHFDHGSTRFPLTFSHATTACSACHPGGRYVGTPSTCEGCHLPEDAHGGRFGQQCGACHRPTRWSDATFDHNLARFRLTGAHTRTACTACHTSGGFAGTPMACSACHGRPSSHGSAFSGECSACHSTAAWRPASFNGPHSFPMNHGGAGGSCGRCHPSGLMEYTCYTCHNAGEMQDKHKEIGGFSSSCTRCHASGEEGDDD